MNFLMKSVLCNLLLVSGILGAGGFEAVAQYVGPAIASPAKFGIEPPIAMNANYGDVKIVPGDVISIVTYGAPELTTTSQTTTGPILGASGGVVTGVKVGAEGEVVLPYLGSVKLAGKTPSEAAVYLSSALKEGGFLTDPQVSVQLVESPTRVITVIGEVQKPAPIPAFGQIRLLEAISTCGGLTPLASHTITIRRFGNPDAITVELGAEPKSANLSNIPLMPGDTVIVPRVGSVFVVGEVKTQEAIQLSGDTPITVMRAIAMAGGVNFGAALSKARIIRTNADNKKVEIMLDLKRMMYGKQQDVALLTDDILFIPMNGFKAALSNGAANVAATSLYGIAYTTSVLK